MGCKGVWVLHGQDKQARRLLREKQAWLGQGGHAKHDDLLPRVCLGHFRVNHAHFGHRNTMTTSSRVISMISVGLCVFACRQDEKSGVLRQTEEANEAAAYGLMSKVTFTEITQPETCRDYTQNSREVLWTVFYTQSLVKSLCLRHFWFW